MGFNVQLRNVFVDATNVVIKIEGKGLDNTIIALVERIVKPRVPKLLQDAITKQVNPLISNLTCNRIEE